VQPAEGADNQPVCHPPHKVSESSRSKRNNKKHIHIYSLQNLAHVFIFFHSRCGFCA